MSSLHRSVITVVCVLLFASLALAYSSGAPNGYTGGPGEGNCTTCHSSFPLNSGSGSLAITAPAGYVPGDTIDITVDLAHTGQDRWGFILTALDQSGNAVGNLIITDPSRTQKSVGGGRQYVKHTSSGTYNGVPNASPGWTFRWASPLSPSGTVLFYAAGNAANGNFSTSGDYIYTTSTSVTEEQPPCCIGTRGDVNGDGGDINIVDLTCLADFLFGDGCSQPCPEEADANGDLSGPDILDLTFIVDFLFGVTPPLVPCP
ncbi:MAG: choice-of-anchor V domain-containing protein [Candidatus Zixiibacteriota bacterium]